LEVKRFCAISRAMPSGDSGGRRSISGGGCARRPARCAAACGATS